MRNRQVCETPKFCESQSACDISMVQASQKPHAKVRPFAKTFAKKSKDIMLRPTVRPQPVRYSWQCYREAIFLMPVFCSAQPHRP